MTSWWNKNSEKRIDDFKSWVGDFNQPSKIYCRKYVSEKKYKSIIDCGCGLASEYYGYKNDKYNIQYTGLDSCKYFISNNSTNNINMIEAELEQPLPIVDSKYDVVYSREVLEHLSCYENTISEFIRIAKKEVLIVFFIKPTDLDEQINYWDEEDLYHNVYNKQKMENFIKTNIKVDRLVWDDLSEKECVLHIILK